MSATVLTVRDTELVIKLLRQRKHTCRDVVDVLILLQHEFGYRFVRGMGLHLVCALADLVGIPVPHLRDPENAGKCRACGSALADPVYKSLTETQASAFLCPRCIDDLAT